MPQDIESLHDLHQIFYKTLPYFSMYTLYGIPNCDTVKKTLDWFKANKIPYQFHDYKKQGISLEKLNEWLTQRTWDELVNRKGQTWKQIPEEEKPTDTKGAIALMLAKTSVIRRPIIENGPIIAIGFDIQKLETLKNS